MDPRVKAARAFFRPRRPEAPVQCASCPFRQGNDAEFKKVVNALKKANGDKSKTSVRSLAMARLRVRSDVAQNGEFACHRTVYGPDMETLPEDLRRQCPGATRAFKGLE